MPQPPRTVLHATRVSLGWTQSELASAVGVSQSQVSLLESGEPLSGSDLITITNIAATFDVAVELLMQPAPDPRVTHSLQASLPRGARNQFLASVTLAHAHVNLLLGSRPHSTVREPDLHSLPRDFAERLRRRWAFPPGPVSGLLRALEAHGIVCIYRDLTPVRTAALASVSASGQSLLFLNTQSTNVELAWAVAHELGHLVFGGEPSKHGERDADAFAAALLMPAHDLLADDSLLGGLPLGDSAANWGVPPRALARRLREIRKVTDLQFRDLVREHNDSADYSGRSSLLGAPAILANAVRGMGGSSPAARRMLLPPQALRGDYLAGSRSAGR